MPGGRGCAGYLHGDRGRKMADSLRQEGLASAWEDGEERPHVSSRLRRAGDPFEAQGRYELQEER